MCAMSSRPTQAAQRLRQEMQDLDKKEVRVGWFASAKYPDGTPVAYVAAIQEHGVAARSLPPRPFFKPTKDARSQEWAALMKQGVKAISKGSTTALNVLEALGLQAAGDVRVTISQIQSPPLSLITLLARKYRKEHMGREGYKPVAGAKIGEFAKTAKSGEADVSGVSKKPLVDTRILITTLTSTVGNKT